MSLAHFEMDHSSEMENVGSPFFLFPQQSEISAGYQTSLEQAWYPELHSDIQLEDISDSCNMEPGELFDLGVTSFAESPYSSGEHTVGTSSEDSSYHIPEVDVVHAHRDKNPPNDSVTSKLKSVLISRQKHRDRVNSDQDQSNVNSEPSLVTGNTHTSLRFPPCCVCGGTASGLHYGVNTCEPCKGFFTRHLRKKDSEEYVCNKSNNCEITNRLRGNCSACRLKKCLRLGMSRQNSRLGRYSLTRRMETIMKVKSLDDIEAKKDKTTLGDDASGQTGVDNSAIDETMENMTMEKRLNSFYVNVKSPNGFSEKLVKSLVQYMEKIKPYGGELDSHEQIMDKLNEAYDSYQLKIQVFGNLKSIPKDEYFNLLKVHGIEIDHRMMYLKQSENEIVHVIERYCNFAKQIPTFSHLTNKDQSNLLKSSRYDFFMILMHEGYLHDKKVFLAHNGVAFHQEEVADKFFSRTLVFAVCDMYHRLQKLKLSSKEKALLIAISLLFTDRCTLDNPDVVEKMQICLVQLLRTQLEKTCKTSAFRRFIQIVNCLTVMRNSSELYLKEYNMLCKDEDVIEEVPIMTEMLFDH